MIWPSLVTDDLEWEESPGATTWSILVPVDAGALPGLPEARAALAQLPVLIHPDHYLHITLRQLDGIGSADSESLDVIGAVVAATPAWEAKVRGVKAFPTAIWADADVDGDGLFLGLIDKLLSPIGSLPEHRYRTRAVCHMTLGYSLEDCPAEKVQATLEPLQDLVLGEVDVHTAVLAELLLDHPYPHWDVLRRFPLGG